MAIVIPSSKTYDRQNPKVRDNVIERIEVGAVEVVPNNEYEMPVYNEKIESGWHNEQKVSNTQQAQKNTPLIGGENQFFWYRSVAYISLNPIYLPVKIIIPRVKNNKYINKIYHSYKDNLPDIKITVYADEYKGTATANGYYDFLQDENGTGATVADISTNYPLTPNNFSGELKPALLYNHDNPNLDVNVNLNYTLKENILNPNFDDTTDPNNYIIEFNCLVGYEQVFLGGERSGYFNGISSEGLEGSSEGNLTLSGKCVKYSPKQVEITIYGDTTGINLNDKTVYINGKTAKKVHSVDSNELMQTSNYLHDSGKNAIETMYEKCRKEYEHGKETAIIRCSISDYYDGDQKVISIDNSTGKMSFDIGDQVIPMVYGADGKDRPMSTYQDGSAKEFEVLGKEKFYDGAVWQELSLQELLQEKKEEIIEPLIVPIISINNNILNISNIDTRATYIAIFVDGNQYATTNNNTFDLSIFNLSVGVYKITAKAVTVTNSESQESNQVTFIVVEQEEPEEPEILKDFEIDNMVVIDGDTKENIADVFDEGAPTIEQDEEGNTLFNYENLALVISSNSKKDPNNLLWLVSGEKIIFFPFDMNSSNYEHSLNWIYRITIKEAKNGAIISYKDIEGIERTIGFNFWNDPPITIEFYMDNGVGTIKITDKDGYGNTVTNVDFSMGVTILSN